MWKILSNGSLTIQSICSDMGISWDPCDKRVYKI